MTLRRNDPRHGTTNGYSNLKCRCRACRDAWAAYTRDVRLRRVIPAPDDPRHGKPSTYRNYRCRCEACTAAATAETMNRRRAKAAES